MAAEIKFHLHHTDPKTGKRSIRLSYLCQNGKHFKDGTGKSVLPEHFVKQRVKGVKGAEIINASLNAKEKRVSQAIEALRNSGTYITPQALRSYLKGESMTFWAFFEAFIKSPPPDIRSQQTIRTYKTWYGVLREFEKKYGKIEFRSFDQNMADTLTKYLREENYNDSSIGVAFMKYHAILGYAKKAKVIPAVPDFTTPAKGIDAGAVYLNEKEINILYEKTQARFNHPEEQKVRRYAEIWILGSQLGLRNSDMKISKHNFIDRGDGNMDLDLSNRKGFDQVVIPLSPLAKKIAEKYDYKIPDFSEESMNRYIKVACKVAGFTEQVIKRAIEKGALKESVYEKWDRVFTHTMRRSFATNMFLKGVPVYIIMKITGHKTEVSFMKYIRISKQEAANVMRKYF